MDEILAGVGIFLFATRKNPTRGVCCGDLNNDSLGMIRDDAKFSDINRDIYDVLFPLIA